MGIGRRTKFTPVLTQLPVRNSLADRKGANVAKNLFRPNEIHLSHEKVHISPPEIMIHHHKNLQKQAMEKQVEEYKGPTIDMLRQEAELFRANWEQEKEALIEAAQKEAEKIIQDAETHAFEEVKKKNDGALKLKIEAEDEARKITESAHNEARDILEKAQKEAQILKEEMLKNARQEGFEAGFGEGAAEVDRLVKRVHVVLTKAIERRNEIIEESEGQLVQLVLQIAKKVIKVLSENQKNIVINNVVQALRKLRSKADVVIRVNLSDLKATTEHTQELIEKFERVNSITVMEDATVDPGGCIIETDFGQIDARISSQLREIEEKILELTPISAKHKPVSGTGT